MRKMFSNIRNSKAVVAVSGALASGVAMAEGATSGVDATLVTSYITDGKTQVIAVLTAGAAIVGAFFVWGLIKRPLTAPSDANCLAPFSFGRRKVFFF